MKSNQKFTPKYWCVHDKNTDDVFVKTMSKSLSEAESLFLHHYSFSRYGIMDEYKLLDKFYDDENLETVLVELDIVVGR